MKRPIVYVVETIDDKNFVFVGLVMIDYQWVLDAIEATGSITHNPPSKFAKREAEKKYPDVNPHIVKPLTEWEEVYGNIKNYKRGDIVK